MTDSTTASHARATTPSASPPAASPSADPRGGDDVAFFSGFDFFSLPDLLLRAPLADDARLNAMPIVHKLHAHNKFSSIWVEKRLRNG